MSKQKSIQEWPNDKEVLKLSPIFFHTEMAGEQLDLTRVDTRKVTVAAVIAGYKAYVGIAVVHPNDNFSKSKGRLIAGWRAKRAWALHHHLTTRGSCSDRLLGYYDIRDGAPDFLPKYVVETLKTRYENN
ncbi:hypothetical protein LCGC14_0145490 [marine sediment metagenome]|uniref:Uncharacterized protein n=1 Tax=marine sediment metagenome TaxID=412755 RepID=A0A0F9UZS5_9ZZZZ